jgi:hypothetical protein
MNKFTFFRKKATLVPAMYWDGSYQSFQLISDWANGRNSTDRYVRHATRDECDVLEVLSKDGTGWRVSYPPSYIICRGVADFLPASAIEVEALYETVDVDEAVDATLAGGGVPAEPLLAIVEAAERAMYENDAPSAEDDLPLTLASPTLQYATLDEAAAEDRDFKIWGPPPEDLFAFDTAIVALKRGHRVARAGWNGKDMWICLGEGSKITDPAQFWNKHTRRWAERRSDVTTAHYVLPYFIMKTADDKILMGWLASQSDLLAADWYILQED